MKYLGPDKPRRVGNLEEIRNLWGSHNKHAFTPASDAPVRCPACNSLIDAAYLYTEKACPNCHKRYTKKLARDMSVEAMQVRVMNKNWKKEVLEVLNGKPPSYISNTLQARPINSVALNMAASFIAVEEEERRKMIKKAQMQKLLSQSPVNKL